MSEKMKPCPRCGSIKTIVHSAFIGGQLRFFVECADDTCAHHGGVMLSEKEAIDDWNALPRRPHYTTERPTKPGWYWYIPADNYYGDLRPLHVEDVEGTMFYGDPMLGVARLVSMSKAGQWAGPIDMPIPCPRRR